MLEDAGDGAHTAVSQLLRKATGRRQARIVYSGRATATSQKIHK